MKRLVSLRNQLTELRQLEEAAHEKFTQAKNSLIKIRNKRRQVEKLFESEMN